MPLINHPTGNYRFLPGIAPYSCGVVAAPGYEIAHVTLHYPVPYRDGFERIAQFLTAEQRPKSALCGIELRSPRPFTFPGFADFNAGYAGILEHWGVFVAGVNPVARTNVAPKLVPPAEPVLYGFSYTKPTARNSYPTFVVAGAGELPEGVLAADAIVSRGDISAAGIRKKARFVMDLMESRLHGLGVDWPLVSTADVYTIHTLDALLEDEILRRMESASLHGVHWHYTMPPIEEIEFEMDLRGVNSEIRWD